jgi:hypothetical protein
MPGPNRAVAALCIAIIAIAALVPPGLASFDAAWFEVPYVLLPPGASVAIPPACVAPSEQPLPLFSVPGSRAPPHNSLA